jgi:tetratricopeptide (TPR) repeat protein
MDKPTLHRPFLLCALVVIIATSAGSPLPARGAGLDADRAIAQSQHKVRRSPYNSSSYYQLGDAYIQKGRESGDPMYFELAEEALKKSLSLNPEQSGARRHLAYVKASRHDFAGAATEAEMAIASNPNDADAQGVLGDAYLELGKFDQAETAYKRMVSLKGSLAAYSRLSGLKSLRGDHKGSVADLKTAIALGRQQSQPRESIAWAQWQLASDYFSRGNFAEAERELKNALESYPDYYRALAGVAQVRAAQGRYDEAIRHYQRAIDKVPMLEHIAALGEVYEKLGRLDDARKQYQLVEYIGKLNALNKALYNRELAYFYADHDINIQDGLALAERELEYRKDIYAYDVLAWNLYKNGKLNQARDAMKEALRLSTQDAKLFYHAGMIYHGLGELNRAKEFLRRALAVNPRFHVLFADRAAELLATIENSGAPVAARAQD